MMVLCGDVALVRIWRYANIQNGNKINLERLLYSKNKNCFFLLYWLGSVSD